MGHRLARRDSPAQFLALDQYVARPGEPQLHSAVANLKHLNLNRRADHDNFVYFACKYQHGNSSMSGREVLGRVMATFWQFMDELTVR